ncbi:U6 snRNA phosphodiesterase Usb1 [Astrocystis sublimbata]|nr:U6 snRNA phosphodiesterase Usb1 [Astrocystis sublimbata]
MALVDYTSDSSEPDDTASPSTKRQKTSAPQLANRSTTKSHLPPLPSAFHDLYASSVRVSASDDPTLHQGRKRVNPHRVGNWPSHLYIEWHPRTTERTTLTALHTNLQASLASSSSTSTPPSSNTDSTTIVSFLTSDLGAQQPLHISLSRPIVLSTSQKDDFLSDIESSIRGSGIPPFELMPAGVEWHRTAESARSFLVLRVSAARKESQDQLAAHEGGGEPTEGGTVRANPNPQLAALLRRTNAVVTAHGQPPLYAFPSALEIGNCENRGRDEDDNAKPKKRKTAHTKSHDGSTETATATVENAFHISIAWSFAEPTAELRRLTEAAFNSTIASPPPLPNSDGQETKDGEGRNPTPNPTTTTATTATTLPVTAKDAVGAMRIRIDGVKVKIGNVVTHVPLPDRGRHSSLSSTTGHGLLGL